MEKSKPIVPGCLCIVLPNKCQLFVGQFCTAIEKMPLGMKDRHGVDISHNWLTDLPPIASLGVRRWTVKECYLMRIDDPDNQKQFVAERNLENLKPKETKCPTQQPSVESSQ